MKKVYLAPQTEAIKVIAKGVLMASPGGGFTDPDLGYGGAGSGGFGGN